MVLAVCGELGLDLILKPAEFFRFAHLGAINGTEITEDTMHVIFTIPGPSLPVIVRHKERAYGIWAKRDMVVVYAVPSFYTVATSRN